MNTDETNRPIILEFDNWRVIQSDQRNLDVQRRVVMTAKRDNPQRGVTKGDRYSGWVFFGYFGTIAGALIGIRKEYLKAQRHTAGKSELVDLLTLYLDYDKKFIAAGVAAVGSSDIPELLREASEYIRSASSAVARKRIEARSVHAPPRKRVRRSPTAT